MSSSIHLFVINLRTVVISEISRFPSDSVGASVDRPHSSTTYKIWTSYTLQEGTAFRRVYVTFPIFFIKRINWFIIVFCQPLRKIKFRNDQIRNKNTSWKVQRDIIIVTMWVLNFLLTHDPTKQFVHHLFCLPLHLHPSVINLVDG